MNFSSPVIVGAHAYGLGPVRNIICIEINTGKIVWSKEGYIQSAENAYASFLALRNKILILTDGGELVLIAADPSRFIELGRTQVCGRNWCYPAYAGGKIYVRDGLKGTGNLYCIELAENTPKIIAR
jgi:outer membrane protein assembly factor BamB